MGTGMPPLELHMNSCHARPTVDRPTRPPPKHQTSTRTAVSVRQNLDESLRCCSSETSGCPQSGGDPSSPTGATPVLAIRCVCDSWHRYIVIVSTPRAVYCKETLHSYKHVNIRYISPIPPWLPGWREFSRSASPVQTTRP